MTGCSQKGERCNKIKLVFLSAVHSGMTDCLSFISETASISLLDLEFQCSDMQAPFLEAIAYF